MPVRLPLSTRSSVRSTANDLLTFNAYPAMPAMPAIPDFRDFVRPAHRRKRKRKRRFRISFVFPLSMSMCPPAVSVNMIIRVVEEGDDDYDDRQVEMVQQPRVVDHPRVSHHFGGEQIVSFDSFDQLFDATSG